MRNKTNIINKRFRNKNDLGNYEFIIVEYNNSDDVWVEFQDEYKAKVHTTHQHCKEGNVKNPYKPSVLNIGFLGLMSDGNKPITRNNNKNTREYDLWHNMLKRCYSEASLKDYPSYRDVEVCDRWKCFANFLEDIKLIEGYNLWINSNEYELDKDIKGNNSKIYCLENCCFIKKENNIRESAIRNNSHLNLQEVNRNRTVKIYGINIETNERTKDFNSITEACKELNIKNGSHISDCLKGRRNKCHGYKWYKVEE